MSRRPRARRPAPAPLRYVPAHLLEGRAHVMVDGAPRRGTASTLSHWPRTPTPPDLRGDLSAELARHALRRPRLPAGVDLASIDHYDVDGVVALGLVVLDGLDAAHGPLLVDAARVGDFDVVTDRRAALIAFTLNSFDTDEEPGATDRLELCAIRGRSALDILFDLAADPERFEPRWRREWAAYEASVRALADGWATIEEVPRLDLAVVRVDTGHRGAGGAAWASAPLHRAAVHSATSCLRVVTLTEGWMEFHYRYESWVRLTSSRPRPRVDLGRLAHALNAAESAAGGWMFDGAGSITGALHLVDADARSTIDPDHFLHLVSVELAALDQGPAAWDPYGSG